MEKKDWHEPLAEIVGRVPRVILVIVGIILCYPLVYLFFGLPAFAANLTNTGKPGWVFFMFLQVATLQLIHLKKAYASVNWPTTTGTITSSGVAGISDECSPSIWYKYSVNGKEYVNKEITTQQWNESMHKHHAEEIVAEYPVGSTVKVYFQEKNPSISYLVIGVSVTNWVLSIFFLLGLIASGIWVASLWPGFELTRFNDIINQIPPLWPLFEDIKNIEGL